MISESLKKFARTIGQNEKISEVIVGVSSTMVILETQKAGTAMHYQKTWEGNIRPGSCNLQTGNYRDFKTDTTIKNIKIHTDEKNQIWKGKYLCELTEQLGSHDSLNSSLALAGINALCMKLNEGFENINFIEELEIQPDMVCGIIGYFSPVMEKLKKYSRKVYIFELIDHPDVLPISCEPELLPECDIIIATGTTIVNDTFDDIDKLVKTGQKFILAGPTTPLSTIPFLNTHVTELAGSIITDVESVRNGMINGDSGRKLRKYMDKRIIRLNRNMSL
ncbi:MAG: hypothetical protein JXR95_13790 [Deltaproteobacteria bacterium]|nr:hypothetical protein [Deltaproteobacteria bacterium]